MRPGDLGRGPVDAGRRLDVRAGPAGLRASRRGVVAVPLAFSSTGMIWLSGRITGGHLLAVAWHAVAFALLYEFLGRGGVVRAVMLGLWCGLGLWNDSMGLMTLVGLVPAGVVLVGSAVRTSSGHGPVEDVRTADPARTGIRGSLIALVLAFLVGLLPRFVGAPRRPVRRLQRAVRPDLEGRRPRGSCPNPRPRLSASTGRRTSPAEPRGRARRHRVGRPRRAGGRGRGCRVGLVCRSWIGTLPARRPGSGLRQARWCRHPRSAPVPSAGGC